MRSRTAHSPKLHVVDSGLAAYLLAITPEKLARRNPAALAQFGHLFETFVVGELLKQASWRDDVRELGQPRVTASATSSAAATSSTPTARPRVDWNERSARTTVNAVPAIAAPRVSAGDRVHVVDQKEDMVRPTRHSARFAVHQHLVIERVVRRPETVKVRLRHQSGAIHWVTYRVPAVARDVSFLRLAEWKEHATALTYVCGGGNGVLIDDQAFFRAAFAD